MEKQKLQFQIQNIPEGESTAAVQLSENDLQIEKAVFLGGNVRVHFYKAERFIQVKFTVDADLKLTCDRSLKEFTKHISDSYKVLFNADEDDLIINENSAVKPIPGSMVLDIENEVRDTIMLNIPVKKIHPDYLDSEGRPKDFETKKFGDISGSEDDNIDPRWEALKKLKTNN